MARPEISNQPNPVLVQQEPNLLLDSDARHAYINATYAKELAEKYQSQEFKEKLAGQFYEDGLKAYDTFMIGEKWGKQLYLAGLAMGAVNGMGIAFFGDPGGGKSTLMEKGTDIINGIDAEHIAEIPHTVEFTKAQLLGDVVPMDRSGVDREGHEYKEFFNAVVRALIRPETKVLKFDEANRANQLTMQAALKVMQKGQATVFENNKEVKTGKFDLILFAENHYGTEFSFPADPALINRRAAGAFLGVMPKPKTTENGLYVPMSGHTEAARHMLANPNEEPKDDPEVPKVIDLEILHLIRSGIHMVEYNKAEIGLTDHLTVKMIEEMKKAGVRSSDPRIVKQVMRLGQTLAMFNKRPVDKVDVASAVNYALTSRLASMGTMEEEVIEERVDNVLKAA